MPWTSRRTRPSGTRRSWWITPTVPTRWRSSGVAGSVFASRCATSTRSRLPRITSSTSRTERGCPTASGTAVSGNMTASRSGRTGSASGMAKSPGPSPEGTAISGLRTLGQRDVEQATVVARLDSLGIHRSWQRQLHPERALADAGRVVHGLLLARGELAVPFDDQHVLEELHLEVVFFDTGEVERD